MATVYLAIQESFEREVALKVMSPDLLADDNFGERFLREAKIVSRLVHPNIVSVYDVGIHNGYYFLSMEYVPGKDLTHKRLDLSLLERLRVVKEIARALDFAGKKGYVHRDVKPENIMLHEEDGRAILMDFGIARPSDTASGMTQVGIAIGTPHYMSPEQAKGLSVDPRSDLYSLGVVLFLLVTGAVPYDGESAVVVGIMHISEDIPCLPPYLEVFQPIIDKIMAKNPERRYQTGAEFIAALDAIPAHVLASVAEASTREAMDDKTFPKPLKVGERKVKRLNTTELAHSNTIVARSEDRIVRHQSNSPKKSGTSSGWLVLSLIVVVAAASFYFQEDIKQRWQEYFATKIDVPVIDKLALVSATTQSESPPSMQHESKVSAQPTVIAPSPTTEQSTVVVQSAIDAQPPTDASPTFMEQIKVLRDSLKQDWRFAPELVNIYRKEVNSNNSDEQQAAQAGLDELQNFYANLIQKSQQENTLSVAQEYANSAEVVFAADEKIAALQDALTALNVAKAANEQLQKAALQQQQQQQQQKQKELSQLKQKQQNIEQDLLNTAKIQQAAGKLIAPSGDNALKTYRELLAQNAQHSAAREGVIAVENLVVKRIEQLISEEKFTDASAELVNARESFPQSKALLGLSMDLEHAIADKVPTVSRLLVTSNEVNKLAQQDPSIAAERIIYIGFEYRNFKGEASVLQAILYDGSRSLQIAQVPVVVNGSSGLKFFRIEQPVTGFADGGYNIDLLFEQQPLISSKFSVKK